jgi:hypothetical protein
MHSTSSRICADITSPYPSSVSSIRETYSTCGALYMHTLLIHCSTYLCSQSICIAQALYFDAVRTQCGHVFCRVCAEKGDLCIICGATACPLQSDSDMQGDTHVRAVFPTMLLSHSCSVSIEMSQYEYRSHQICLKPFKMPKVVRIYNLIV